MLRSDAWACRCQLQVMSDSHLHAATAIRGRWSNPSANGQRSGARGHPTLDKTVSSCHRTLCGIDGAAVRQPCPTLRVSKGFWMRGTANDWVTSGSSAARERCIVTGWGTECTLCSSRWGVGATPRWIRLNVQSSHRKVRHAVRRGGLVCSGQPCVHVVESPPCRGA